MRKDSDAEPAHPNPPAPTNSPHLGLGQPHPPDKLPLGGWEQDVHLPSRPAEELFLPEASPPATPTPPTPPLHTHTHTHAGSWEYRQWPGLTGWGHTRGVGRMSWSPSPTQPHIVPHLCTLPLCASGRLPTIPFQIWHGQPGWLLPPCSEPPLRKHGPCVCPSPTSNPLWPHPLGPWLGTPGHTRTRVPTRPTGPVQCYRASLMPPCPKAGKMPP